MAGFRKQMRDCLDEFGESGMAVPFIHKELTWKKHLAHAVL